MNASQTDPLTYLDEVDARTAAATEGPWMSVGLEIVNHPDGEVVCDTVTDYPSDRRVFNSDFIAHARQDLPALSKALRAVLGMHQEGRKSAFDPVGMWVSSVCRHCRKEWPCPTVRAVQAAFAVNDEGGKR